MNIYNIQCMLENVREWSRLGFAMHNVDSVAYLEPQVPCQDVGASVELPVGPLPGLAAHCQGEGTLRDLVFKQLMRAQFRWEGR